MSFKTEADMFEPLRDYFEGAGYEIYSEVVLPGGGRADIVAANAQQIVCIEMKKTLSMTLIDQVIERKRSFAYVYIAIPERKVGFPRFLERIFRKYGIGILYVHSDGSIQTERAAVYRRAFDKKTDIRAYLKQEQKYALAGGSKGGGYITDYRLMIIRVRRYLEAKGDWIELREVLQHCETYYKSPVSSLSSALRQFESEWCEVETRNKKLHVRAKQNNN